MTYLPGGPVFLLSALTAAVILGAGAIGVALMYRTNRELGHHPTFDPANYKPFGQRVREWRHR